MTHDVRLSVNVVSIQLLDSVFFLSCEWFITTQSQFKQTKDCQKKNKKKTFTGARKLFPQFSLIYSEVPVGHKNSFDGSILNNQCRVVLIHLLVNQQCRLTDSVFRLLLQSLFYTEYEYIHLYVVLECIYSHI